MRYRDSLADGRRADPLPFRQNFKHAFLIQKGMRGSQPIRHLLKDGIFFAAGKPRNDGLNVEKIRDLHAFALLRPSLFLPFCLITCRSILSTTKSIAE